MNLLFQPLLYPFLRKIKAKTIDSTLVKSLNLLDDVIIDEIKKFIISHRYTDGGFVNKAGKSDLYYSLFGYFLTEAFAIKNIKESIKNYIIHFPEKENLKGVHLYCFSILYAKLIGFNHITDELKTKVKNELNSNYITQSEYNNFLGILSLYYLKDYLSIKKYINQFIERQTNSIEDKPCTIYAAEAVLKQLAGKQTDSVVKKITSFYCNDGSYKALKLSPVSDLLSTAVALYALKFTDYDLIDIKPDCFEYINSLYFNGGFAATIIDNDTDLEYTFYGLLALGSLS